MAVTARADQKLYEIVGTCSLIEMTPEHHDEKGAGEILGNGRSLGPASLELFIDGLQEHGHPMECLSAPQAQHDRHGQRGMELEAGRRLISVWLLSSVFVLILTR